MIQIPQYKRNIRTEPLRTRQISRMESHKSFRLLARVSRKITLTWMIFTVIHKKMTTRTPNYRLMTHLLLIGLPHDARMDILQDKNINDMFKHEKPRDMLLHVMLHNVWSL